MLDVDLMARLALSLGLGLLVGLQRESSNAKLAGIRTFPLIAISGSLAALLARDFGGWVLAAGVLAIAAFAVVGNVTKIHQGSLEPGLTTETMMLLMFVVGAYCMIGEPVFALVVGGVAAVLLQLKKPLHQAVTRLGEHDVRAIMQFALISLVVLPVLPRQDFGPYQVLNLQEIWLMVVLIVGIGLCGYLAFKFFGERLGVLLAGLLGGLISSTATTVSYARQSRQDVARSPAAAVVILLASTLVFVRVLLEMAAVDRVSLAITAPPIACMLLAMATLSAVEWGLSLRSSESRPAETLELENPSELRSALIFGALYAAVLLAVAAAKDHLGLGGLYAVSVLSGLTDMDAITLSTSQLTKGGQLTAATGWRVILVAGMSNLVFKLGLVAVLGARQLAWRLSLHVALALAVGGALLIFWPG